MPSQQMPLDTLLTHLQALAQDALTLWELPMDASIRLINVSENVTYLVEAPHGFRAVLRVHRESYHSPKAIACELAWMAALRADEAVIAPNVLPGRDGQLIQMAHSPALSAPRYMVLFEFLEGRHPDETGDLVPSFKTLGQIAARTHLHAITWQRPAPFERLHWTLETVFGATPTWGNWRDAPNVDASVRAVLERVETTVKARLTAFGQTPERFGLIHADMRLANLLIHEGETRLIDFDDCGFGWFLYDFAAAISFIEDDPRVPAMKAAWLEGYRTMRPLSDADAAEMDSLIMLRRMALLAWIGSHIEAPEPQALAPTFAEASAVLGERYLQAFA